MIKFISFTSISRVALVVSIFFLVGCAIGQDQEITMGRQVAPQFEEQFGGLYPDEQVQKYVDGVGQSLVAYAGRQDLPWQFRVLSSDQINAFALPGGFVYITQGLLYQLENEAQLAGILGHEIGHVVHRHSVQQIQRAQGAQVIPLLAGVFGTREIADVAGAVTSLALMRYSRGQESESDMSGLTYMTRGGYNPQGLVRAMEIMREASPGGSPPEFLSTHPNPGNRIQSLNERIDSRYRDAARDGITGEESFRRNVLNRRRDASGARDAEAPALARATPPPTPQGHQLRLAGRVCGCTR